MVRLQEVQADQDKESAELAKTVATNPTEQSSENLLEVIRSVHQYYQEIQKSLMFNNAIIDDRPSLAMKHM